VRAASDAPLAPRRGRKEGSQTRLGKSKRMFRDGEQLAQARYRGAIGDDPPHLCPESPSPGSRLGGQATEGSLLGLTLVTLPPTLFPATSGEAVQGARQNERRTSPETEEAEWR
jgi:hypothetical protein